MFSGVVPDTVKQPTTAEKAHISRTGLELVDKWMGTFLCAQTEPTGQFLFVLWKTRTSHILLCRFSHPVLGADI